MWVSWCNDDDVPDIEKQNLRNVCWNSDPIKWQSCVEYLSNILSYDPFTIWTLVLRGVFSHWWYVFRGYPHPLKSNYHRCIALHGSVRPGSLALLVQAPWTTGGEYLFEEPCDCLPGFEVHPLWKGNQTIFFKNQIWARSLDIDRLSLICIKRSIGKVKQCWIFMHCY